MLTRINSHAIIRFVDENNVNHGLIPDTRS
jgi:hypothetical protein